MIVQLPDSILWSYGDPVKGDKSGRLLLKLCTGAQVNVYDSNVLKYIYYDQDILSEMK